MRLTKVFFTFTSTGVRNERRGWGSYGEVSFKKVTSEFGNRLLQRKNSSIALEETPQARFKAPELALMFV